MAGYIGNKSSVTLVDGYSEAEADAEFVAITGDSMTGNLSLGDNNKAIFGAGSDLQIYHDGSNSYIEDAGAGNLTIKSNTLVIADTDGDNMLVGLENGEARLYNNGSQKLATTATGIQVTGSIAAGAATFTTADNTNQLTLVSTDADANAGPNLNLRRNSASPADGDLTGQLTFTNNNDAGEGTDYATMYAVSADVSDGSEDAAFYIKTMSAGTLRQRISLTDTATVFNEDSIDLDFRVESDNLTHALFVQGSDGNVGVGTSSPSADFVVSNGGAAGIELQPEIATDTNRITNYDRAASAYMNFRLDALTHQFLTSSTERCRIDGSGNVFVARTAEGDGNVGHTFRADGFSQTTRSGGLVADFNRKSSDGDILRFQKDGTTVGTIGTNGGNPYFAQASKGIGLSSARMYPVTNTGAVSDNTMDIGNTNARFDDIFATNGTIQTSDFNEKQDIASLTATEMLVGKRISTLFKTFRWKDSVADKGEDARTHTGVIAQDVQAAFTAEGLDAGDYALFISSTWWETQTDVPAVEAVAEVTDEDGNVTTEAVEAVDAYTRTDTYDTEAEAPEGATSKTRMGIRYPELLSFVAAYNEQRFASIEARLTALEAQNMSGYIGTQPVPQATQTRDAFTATAGQTSFATRGYTPNFLDVFLNGVKLAAADYTATNGSDVVLASGAVVNDILEVVAYTAFDTANVTASSGFTVTGNLSVDGGTIKLDGNYPVGTDNVALGDTALDTTTGSYNTAIGSKALTANTSGITNSALGVQALEANTTGSDNTSMGGSSLRYNTTGTHNTAMGRDALRSNTTASNNTAVGYQAAYSNTTGDRHVALGYSALKDNTTGYRNNAIGYLALTTNTTGFQNNALGVNALRYNTTGTNNVAIGHEAGLSNTTGAGNSAVGKTTLQSNTTGANNTAVGLQALNGNTTAADNTAVGMNALVTNTTGASNTAVGRSALQESTTASNNTAVGYQSLLANTTGAQNTGIGMYALASNTTATDNFAGGYNSLGANTTGTSNIGIGHRALQAITTASNNTALGSQAGYSRTGSGNTCIGQYSGRDGTSGTDNTLIGRNAGYHITSGSNNTIIGTYDGNSGGLDIRTASNNVVISDGDGNIKYSYTNADNTTKMPDLYANTSGTSANLVVLSSGTIARSTSSLKYKRDVQDATHGLTELLTLRPVTYKGKNVIDGDIVFGGLIAEEVHDAGLTEFVQYADDETPDALSYGHMVSLCIKAIQELSTKNDALSTALDAALARITTLEGE